MARVLSTIAKLALPFAVAGVALEASETALEHDDECLASDPSAAGCALSAMQLRGLKDSEEGTPSEPDAAGSDVLPATGPDPIADDEVPKGLSAQVGWWHGWSQGGDKMWGSGTGTEVINSGNVGYYDKGMYEARSRCGGPSCALMTNPEGHRTKEIFHIHFFHYHSYGASLKHKLEDRVCGRGGWHSGGFPCHGKAAFFPGSPGVFSEALTGGSIAHAMVIAWPMSCGGRGTIVELAYGCSIEHQIRGDFNPAMR